MKKLSILFTVFIMLFAVPVYGGGYWDNSTSEGLLPPFKHNQYGLGRHSDATGRPFEWQTGDGKSIEPWNRVTPDGYGPGIGIDQFGRAVRPVPYN